jgi:hypothetical protein
MADSRVNWWSGAGQFLATVRMKEERRMQNEEGRMDGFLRLFTLIHLDSP